MPVAPDPIRIGYCLSLTGPVADNAQSARLAHEIWREGVNRRGGLLGRPVELVCRDDRADALRVPELYRQLLDEDKVDPVVGGYYTNTVASAPYGSSSGMVSAQLRFLVWSQIKH